MAKVDIKNFLLKHTVLFVIVFLVFILLFFILRLRKENLLTTKDFIPEVPKIKISELEVAKEHEEIVKKALTEYRPFEDSNYRKKILERNLYDYRDIVKKEALEREIEDKMKLANSLFDQGKYDEVVKITEEILKKMSTYEPAKILLKKAKEKLNLQ